MPKRTDIKKILIIGSGPVVIGQAGEYDYAGSQACKALREEGYEIALVNSNPAAIMTDPDMADRTYIEPLTLESLTKIIEKERPDAILSTFGGQVGFNLGTFLERDGVLKKFGVEMIGADERIIAKAEDRMVFKETMQSIGIPVPRSGVAGSFIEGKQILRELGFPLALRPAYTMGGAGGAAVYNVEEFERTLAFALDTSPIRQTLIEESVLGWKEIEFEVMRDCAGNVAVIASMENIDPMGVHAGDSTIVAPVQTLDPAKINQLADLAEKVIIAVGICGGTSVKFGVNPENGDVVITEINPRVSRSSALASKATGFPMARVAAKLAIGMTFDEIGVARKSPFISKKDADYCVVKVSRFAFKKFPGVDETLNTSMKSVGEAMAIGGDFKEALQKCIRSIEIGRYGLGSDGKDIPQKDRANLELIRTQLIMPNVSRLFFVRYAIENGMSTSDISSLSKIDPWFIDNIRELVDFESKLSGKSLVGVTAETLLQAKKLGYSDIQLAHLLETTEEQVRQRRKTLGVETSYHLADALLRYPDAEAGLYSSYRFDASLPDSPLSTLHSPLKKKVIILGSGPNRIGQGMEFDYSCVHASEALQEEGCESIIVNCNPDAVSTDPAVPNKVYIEPLTREDVLGIIDREKPMGVIISLGGQTPLDLGLPLKKVEVNILGTSPENINRARDHKLLAKVVEKLGLRQTDNDFAASIAEAQEKAAKIGYPALVKTNIADARPVEIVYDEEDLVESVERALEAAHTVIIKGFIEDAVGADVDAISDGETTLVCGVMERIEQAGVHSGDSACSLPPHSLSDEIVNEIKRQTCLLAKELEVRGLMNVQYAIKDDQVYILEVNPYASRTIPFVSKATGVAWAKIAAKVMLGESLAKLGITQEIVPGHVCVKEAVFPFARFSGVDVVLGPEMKSTGEVMGINNSFGHAYIKAQVAAGQNLNKGGTVFLSVSGRSKEDICEIGQGLVDIGFSIVATSGTANTLKDAGISVNVISKIGEGRPDAIDLIKNGEISLIINTPSGKKPRKHEITIRSAVVASGIPIITTIPGAKATLHGMKVVRDHGAAVRSLQEYNISK